MPLLPRWQYMTDESKSMVKKVGFSALAMIFVMGIVRALLPLAVVGVGGYWAYKFLSEKWEFYLPELPTFPHWNGEKLYLFRSQVPIQTSLDSHPTTRPLQFDLTMLDQFLRTISRISFQTALPLRCRRDLMICRTRQRLPLFILGSFVLVPILQVLISLSYQRWWKIHMLDDLDKSSIFVLV